MPTLGHLEAKAADAEAVQEDDRAQAAKFVAEDPLGREAAEAPDAASEAEPDKVRLAQQCMLTALMQPLSEYNSLMGYNTNKMIHLKGDPDLLISQLTKRPGEKEFTDICPEVLAELVPYVRIYKVIRKSSEGPIENTVELTFSNGVKSEELVFGDSPNRGKGVGLKSVDWTFDGSDPFTSSRSIQVNLNFFFQSFEELIRPRQDAEGNHYKYLDLILMANCRELENEQIPEEEPKLDPSRLWTREFFPECHEIKLVVGWSAPEGSSFTKTVPNGEAILTGIENMKTTLWLTLVDHDFNINQDGTFTLQANYMGRIVGLTSDPRANVFIDYKNSDLMSAINNLRSIVEDPKNKCKKEYLKKKKKELGIKMKNQRQALVASIVGEMMDKNYLATIQIPTGAYIKLINAINGGDLLTSGALEGTEFAVTKTISDEMQAKLGALAKAEEDTPPPADQLVPGLTPKVATGAMLLAPLGPAGTAAASAYLLYNAFNPLGVDTLESAIEGGTYEDFYGESVTFEYFYLGDLIEIITDRVLNMSGGVDYSKESDNIFHWRGKEYDMAMENIRIVLGSLWYKFGADEVFKKINISDIPVSLALFLDWLKDNVIDAEREVYPFIAFINDVMTNLVNAALGSNCFDGLLTQRIKVRKTFFSSAGVNGKEPITTMAKPEFAGTFSQAAANRESAEIRAELALEEHDTWSVEESIPPDPAGSLEVESGTSPIASTTEELTQAISALAQEESFYRDGSGRERSARLLYSPLGASAHLRQGLTNESSHYHYVVFYMENTATREKLMGDAGTDAGNGIYHMQLGRQCGLLKNAAFKKTNQQYLREARFAQQTSEEYNPLAQLSNVYDVDFTMVGNNIWIPGKRIYFDPANFGLGKPSDPGSPAHLLGLGGYHVVTGVKSFIESGKFETVVSTRWETGGGSTASRLAPPDNEVGGDSSKCEEEA